MGKKKRGFYRENPPLGGTQWLGGYNTPENGERRALGGENKIPPPLKLGGGKKTHGALKKRGGNRRPFFSRRAGKPPLEENPGGFLKERRGEKTPLKRGNIAAHHNWGGPHM